MIFCTTYHDIENYTGFILNTPTKPVGVIALTPDTNDELLTRRTMIRNKSPTN